MNLNFVKSSRRRPRTRVEIVELWLGSSVAAEIVYFEGHVFQLFLLLLATASIGAIWYLVSEIRGGISPILTLVKMVIFTALALAVMPLAVRLLMLLVH